MNTINIKALSEQVARLDGKVGSIPVGKIPKDYSITEKDTGLKWVDDKEIYSKSYRGEIGVISANTSIQLDTGDITLINGYGVVTSSAGSEFIVPFYSTAALTAYISNNVTDKLILRVGTALSEGIYDVTVYYTKQTAPSKAPDSEPDYETDEVPEEEPETKKVTRKKSTK